MSMDQRKDGNENLDDISLERLFAEARAEAPPPLSAAFEARLVASARGAMPVAAPVPRGWRARLKAFFAEFGGAPSLAGVGVAGMAGVWIGFAAPGPTADLVTSFWQGAASVAPTGWSSDAGDLQYSTGAELLSLLDTETE